MASSPPSQAPARRAPAETKARPPPRASHAPRRGRRSNGDVFIADTGNNRVRQMTPDGVIRPIAGQDEAGFAGDGGAAVSGRLNAPAGLVLDGAGDLYLADSGNNRVRRLAPMGGRPAGIARPRHSVVNAASLKAGPWRRGEIVTIFVIGLGTDRAKRRLRCRRAVPTSLGGAQVRFAGVACRC